MLTGGHFNPRCDDFPVVCVLFKPLESSFSYQIIYDALSPCAGVDRLISCQNARLSYSLAELIFLGRCEAFYLLTLLY